PREVDIVGVGADAEDLGAALAEFGRPPAELGDLGRTHEREVHRPEEDDLPLAGERLVVDLAELASGLGGDDRLGPERRKRLAYAAHDSLLLSAFGRRPCRRTPSVRTTRRSVQDFFSMTVIGAGYRAMVPASRHASPAAVRRRGRRYPELPPGRE